MNHILVIWEDKNKKEWEELRDLLEAERFDSFCVNAHPKAVLEQVVKKIPDLVLLYSKTLPHDKDPVLKTLKEEKDLRDIPVLSLIPKGVEAQIDFGSGIDDFLTFPYIPSELSARLRLLLWRHRRISGKDVIRHGKLVIDLEKYEVSVDGQVLTLTFKEYELLKFLATHPGKVFTRDAILNKVWGYDYYGGTRTVDVHIRRLRSKLEETSHPFLETVRGVGYKFIGEGSNGKL